MAKVEFIGKQETSPRWQGDFGGREHVMPFPAMLDAAQFAANAGGKKYVPSGTLVGRTLAERDAGAGFGPATVATDDEIYLTHRDVADAADSAETEVYRHGKVVKENYLPGFDALAAEVKAKIRALYACVKGEG